MQTDWCYFYKWTPTPKSEIADAVFIPSFQFCLPLNSTIFFSFSFDFIKICFFFLSLFPHSYIELSIASKPNHSCSGNRIECHHLTGFDAIPTASVEALIDHLIKHFVCDKPIFLSCWLIFLHFFPSLYLSNPILVPFSHDWYFSSVVKWWKYSIHSTGMSRDRTERRKMNRSSIISILSSIFSFSHAWFHFHESQQFKRGFFPNRMQNMMILFYRLDTRTMLFLFSFSIWYNLFFFF